MAGSLAGKVCLVTGATRGIGRGIALQLGQAGATVYITGRTLQRQDSLPGSLEDTAKEIVDRGGQCVPIQCDHNIDDQVYAVFDRIDQERDGQLDILVNNAYAAVEAITSSTGTKFWECDDKMWDIVNGVGLRNHYLCTVRAARMMVKNKRGLIINISSFGGLKYLFNVPYGVGKAAVDRMAADCAIELRKYSVAMVSLWPGAVMTEHIAILLKKVEAAGGDNKQAERTKRIFSESESTEFPGKVIVALAQDKNLMHKTGRVLLTSDLGQEYNLRDIDGRQVPNFRSLSTILRIAGWKKTASLMPEFIRVPYFMLTLSASKF